MIERIGGSPSHMEKLLADMRQLRNQALYENVIPFGSNEKVGSTNEAPDFSKILDRAINKVNDAQEYSGHLKKAYELGDPNIDITQVMVASEKAGIAFEAMKQVRNKLVEAYRDVMNMPI